MLEEILPFLIENFFMTDDLKFIIANEPIPASSQEAIISSLEGIEGDLGNRIQGIVLFPLRLILGCIICAH